ncbi:MAG: alpha-amylase family glycosyl hydrolase [Bacteroidales bacterium]|jgi:sucrose phosphorylase
MQQSEFIEKINGRLTAVYGDSLIRQDLKESLFERTERLKKDQTGQAEKWNEKDIILITYGDSILSSKEKPLKTLNAFINNRLQGSVSGVHILPFFPYSSDDGFSVIDYLQVNPELGDWEGIEKIAGEYALMADLVINHVSSKSQWFRDFKKGVEPGRGFFIEADPETDLSAVIRPRSLPLLTGFDTAHGKKYVWTTFSADQIDLNFANPEVLFEILNVLLFYFEKGVKIVRLDAIAFLWKEIGTSCLHLPQTHEVVRLMREIAEYIDSRIIIITETNVPNKENLSYFGKGDEAHMVYQFSLPPLLLHALHTADSGHLTSWAKTLSEIPEGCTFFNFTASHDGIGVRPLEGILPGDEIVKLTEAMKSYGGYVSTKRNSDGTDSPYEMNITYLDALKYTSLGRDDLQVERFICSQTIMMSFKGIPAFYIHSLLGTHNHLEGVKKTGIPRAINRKKWNTDELYDLLSADNEHSRILDELKRRMKIRGKIKAFHPDEKQETLDPDNSLFVLLRGDENELLVISNITPEKTEFAFTEALSDFSDGKDLISGELAGSSKIILKPYQVLWLQKNGVSRK